MGVQYPPTIRTGSDFRLPRAGFAYRDEGPLTCTGPARRMVGGGMGWANFAIDKLTAGETAIIKPHGGSMRPLVESGAEVTLVPADASSVQVGDVVLCRVAGNVFLHLVKAVEGTGLDRLVLIGNNRGKTNGWTKAIYGRATAIRNPVSGALPRTDDD